MTARNLVLRLNRFFYFCQKFDFPFRRNSTQYVMRFFPLIFLACILGLTACDKKAMQTDIESPQKGLSLHVEVDSAGRPIYQVAKNGKPVIATSALGFVAKEGDFSQGFQIIETKTEAFSETWKPVWGQSSDIKNTYNSLTVSLKNKAKQRMDVVFRLFDDGLGFRYVFPEQDLKSVNITDERTAFNMTADHTTWWVPGCWDNDEYFYTQSKLSAVDASFFIKGYKYSNVTTITHKNSVNTPVTMRTADGVHISIHEAALVNFAGMSLLVDTTKFGLKSHLAEDSLMNGVKASVALPYQTPWRTIQITDNAAGLAMSNLILNLNEPNKIQDVSWIKPAKYMGIWWEMHVGKAAWDLKSGKHGATTANAKMYIDFCAENGIPALLIEGWNQGWEQWVGEDREGIFDFQTPYPDFDFKEVVRYGKEKGVEIIGHHETASAVETYEKHMDAAYKLYSDLGIGSVKTGYVGKIPHRRHYAQWMVNHYNRTMEKTAQSKIMLDIHEPIKPTGLCRTYPNLMSAEGMRGQEFNAWSDGNKPAHNVTLPFTRNLAGPMDFTPGIFDLKLEKYKNNVTKVSSFDTRDGGGKPYSRVYSTLAHQLALYVVFYSPVQMAADLPENYRGHPAFQFFRDVAVDWDWTKVVDADIASHVVTVRKEKGKDRWFVGGITGDQAKTATVAFDFLPAGKSYTATIYRDAPETEFMNTPEKYVIETMQVDAKSVKTVEMKAAGGFAISVL
jgi:glucan 1,4-alpha-glucosidase